VNAAEIASALHGHKAGRYWRVRCPVHKSQQESLSLWDGDRRLLVHCHAGCAAGDVLAELRRLGLLDGTYKPEPVDPVGEAADAERMREIARQIWDRARPGPGSPIERWFETRRIALPVPPVLRWAPRCRRPTKIPGAKIFCPAMIARVVDVDGEFLGIRRTFLLPDGSAKAPLPHPEDTERASLGPVRGGAVRLARAVGDHLLVGEGIETSLFAMQAAEFPAWAAGDTSALRNLVLPASIRAVTILVDHDLDPRKGPAAARTAAERFVREGRRVWLAWPPPGCDFNDKWPSSRGAADAR